MGQAGLFCSGGRLNRVAVEETGDDPPSPSGRKDSAMTQPQLTMKEDRRIAAWNSQDVEAVLNCYTDDLVYLDPNTRGEVKGRDNMRRYLRKLFASWNMHWTLRKVYPLADAEGSAALWHASFRRPQGGETVEADGMDLVLLEGDLISRNEVYFDRAVLAPLMGPR